MQETQDQNDKLWVSLNQYNNDPKFREMVEQEFISSPLREKGEIGRREFLKLMGASFALASAACIRRPVNKIVPYVKRPVEIIPGVANYYASSIMDGGQGFGVIMKTREGRPIKVEGLPEHPVNMGGLTARAQALILNLYDPERLKGPKKNLQNPTRTNRDTVSTTWDGADKEVIAQLAKGKVKVLTSTLASPSTNELVRSFCSKFGGEHVVWDVLGADTIREGQIASYGQSVVPRYRFNKAKVIVSIGSDFLGTHLSPAENTKLFSMSRSAGPLMSKLVVFESLMSLTGANADDRIVVGSNQLLDVAMGILYEIIVVNKKSSYAGNSEITKWLESFEGSAKRLGCDPEVFKKLASELWANKGESLVIAGGINTDNESSLALQIAVNMLNSILENDGKTIDAANAPSLTYQGSYSAINSLIADMKSGKVSTLVIHKANPVYALGKEFVEALKKVAMVIYTGDRNDETGAVSDLVLPDHHTLESWGDFEFQKNVFSIQQPTISPMFDTRSFQTSLLTWMKASSADWLVYLKGYWAKNIHARWTGGSKSFDEFWGDVLQNGVVDLSNQGGKRNASASPRSFNAGAIRKTKFEPSSSQELSLILYSKVSMTDGSMANVSWLQELPDPVTKNTWGNYATVSLALAKKLQLKEGQNVILEVGESKITLPVHVQPGQHPLAVGVAVGYGRKGAGSIADGLGANGFSLAVWQGDRFKTSGLKVEITPQGSKTILGCTQEHHALEGRDLIANTTLTEFMKDKSAGIHKHKIFSIWEEHKYTGHKWAMVIDSNACTGCSACMVACQAENNIPVVGKKYVYEGREMHWIRIDRYYQGAPENPQVLFQPMLCQHCDNAPCETVCPVVATSHSSEGLNEMIYNRCVGTRYCSNNCPYKVRRFNWFNLQETDPVKTMAYNPDVTVRSRGVMEKCSFCVQRIKDVKQQVADRKDKLQDGEIKTACEQSCPADAIVFGDVNDPNSRVAKLFKSERSSAVLEDLNVKPSVRYLTKIRNHLIPPKGNSHGGHHA